MPQKNNTYLSPSFFIDSDSPYIIDFAHKNTIRVKTTIEKAISLYYTVRDSIRYNPYGIGIKPFKYKASYVLKEEKGFCIPKAILLAAAARAIKIPARIGFADVKNHLASKRLINIMKTNVFAYHGYTELFLNGKWIKATPAFNKSLCERFNVSPLEFDGQNDSLFHPFDHSGNKYMEYIHQHGSYDDLPFNRMINVFKEVYPHLFGKGSSSWPQSGSLEADIEKE